MKFIIKKAELRYIKSVSDLRKMNFFKKCEFFLVIFYYECKKDYIYIQNKKKLNFH